MSNYTPLVAYTEAVQRFPFPDIQRSGDGEGSLDENPVGDGVFYSEAFTFITGQHSHSPIYARGYFECNQEGQEVSIVALCWLSVKSGGFRKSKISTYIWCEYDLKQNQWNIEINSFEKNK